MDSDELDELFHHEKSASLSTFLHYKNSNQFIDIIINAKPIDHENPQNFEEDDNVSVQFPINNPSYQSSDDDSDDDDCNVFKPTNYKETPIKLNSNIVSQLKIEEEIIESESTDSNKLNRTSSSLPYQGCAL